MRPSGPRRSRPLATPARTGTSPLGAPQEPKKPVRSGVAVGSTTVVGVGGSTVGVAGTGVAVGVGDGVGVAVGVGDGVGVGVTV